jgi:hypothetical protein
LIGFVLVSHYCYFLFLFYFFCGWESIRKLWHYHIVCFGSLLSMHTMCSMKCLSEVFFLIWQSFWSSLLHYPVMRLTYVFIFYFVWFWVFIYFFCEIARYVFFLYGRGLSRKRSKAVAAVAVGS